eukprot:1205507-Prymnesium_polylepis.1
MARGQTPPLVRTQFAESRAPEIAIRGSKRKRRDGGFLHFRSSYATGTGEATSAELPLPLRAVRQ